VGLVCGLLHAVYAISYVGLAFPGPLGAHLAPALALGLLSAGLASLVAAAVLRYPGGMGVISPEATLVIGGVGLQFADAVAPAQLYPTMLATVALVTLATASMLFCVGRARLGYLMHYLPYPVVAGMIGGLGVLLIIGGLELAVPALRAELLERDPAVWPKLAATAGLGTVLWLLHFYRPSVLNIPGAVLACSILFWLLAGGAPGMESWVVRHGEAAVAGGAGPVWTQLGSVDWQAIAGAAPTLAMLVVFLAVIVLTDAASLELALGRHLEPNQTLVTFGLANAAAAAVGGFSSVMSISGSIMAQRSGAACRLVGVTAALVCLGVWLAGPELLAWVPTFVVGGLIVFVGLEFVGEWVILQWFRLNGADRAILLAVVAGVSLAGFPVGFVLGLLLGFLFFVVSCSRLPAIRHETSGRYRFSHVERPEGQRDRLRAAGDSVLVLELGGFLFFGSAWRIYARIRRRALDPQNAHLRAVLLDFSRVSGVDSSGWHNFRKIVELAQQRGFDVVLTRVAPAVERLLQLEGVAGPRLPHVRVLPDLDRGLEWLEEATLARPAPAGCLEEAAASFSADPSTAFAPERLQGYAQSCSFAAGEHLIAQGDMSDDVFILRQGSISIVVDGPEGGRIRLRTAGPGAVVGEIAFILRRPRTAWAVADTPVTADRITRAAVARMAAEEPHLLLALQTSMLRILARRVSDSTELVVQLSR
jgi:SulP family sulfate permease